ncbi:hypothetical protein IE53DRAFT_364271, partial [Violaceomyces palustris]
MGSLMRTGSGRLDSWVTHLLLPINLGLTLLIMMLLLLAPQPSSTSGDKTLLQKYSFKIDQPDKWDGSGGLDQFLTWIHKITHYFSLHGNPPDLLKIQLLGGYLEREPLDWYYKHIMPRIHSIDFKT